MKNKIGKMNGNLVWAFALAAILLGIAGAWLTANMDNKVSTAVYFGVFAACGFLATFLTRSKTGLGVVAFVLASGVAAGIYYVLVSSVFASATTAMVSVGDGAQAEAQLAGNVMGRAVGLFAAGLTFLASLVAGIGGCIAGAKHRKKFVGAV